MEKRKCKECGEEKPLKENFRPHLVKGKIYFEYECRACGNIRAKQWYRDNAEYARSQDRAKYKADPELARLRSRESYWNRREKARKRASERRAENLEKVRAQDRAIAKRWRASHSSESREWARKQRAIKRKAKIEPVTKEQLETLYIRQRGKCAICGKKLTNKHLDHIVPLSKGGAHEIKNFQYLCPRCNLRKHHADPIDFMQKLGFLL